jgi:hypothetical protein
MKLPARNVSYLFDKPQQQNLKTWISELNKKALIPFSHHLIETGLEAGSNKNINKLNNFRKIKDIKLLFLLLYEFHKVFLLTRQSHTWILTSQMIEHIR